MIKENIDYADIIQYFLGQKITWNCIMYYQPNGLNTIIEFKTRNVRNNLGISLINLPISHQFTYLCNDNNSDQSISIIFAVKMSLTKVLVLSMQ